MKIKIGDKLENIKLKSISGEDFELGKTKGKKILLSFYRFAACPMCNLRINELMKRREELEWIVEGDFEEYCANMRYPGAWGGEPEILVATHVLRRPIEVHMAVAGEPLRSIGIYGNEDYGTTKDSKTKLMLLRVQESKVMCCMH